MSRQHEKDCAFMRMAIAAASTSKCLKARYGAVVVDKNGRVVSTGQNGKPQGSTNDGQCYRLHVLPNSERSVCCLHAEANALMYCDRAQSEGGTLYVNGRPCEMCSITILQAGIKRLVFIDGNESSGHLGSSTDEFWSRYGIAIERVPLTLAQVLGEVKS